MSRWFRHYAGMMRDEKLVSAAMRSKQSVERVVWVWGAILESAAEIDDHGKFALETAEAAYFLRADQSDVDAIVAALEDLGRLHEGRVAKWGKRQFSSDRSAERTRDYRHRKEQNSQVDATVTTGDGDVTVTKRHGDAPETETYTEKKEDIRTVATATRPSESPFEDFWKAYPKRKGANPKAPARKKFDLAVKSGADPGAIVGAARRYAAEMRGEDAKFVAQALTWLNQQRWSDYAVIEPTGPPKPPRPDLPSDAELRERYGRQNNRGVSAEAGQDGGRTGADHAQELRRDGAEIRPDVGAGGVSDRHPGKPGMCSLGEIFRPPIGRPAVGLQGAASGADSDDDGPDTVARMV